MKNERNQIVVWDGFIRIFHWSFALLFFLAYATGDENNSFHNYTGYLIVVLVTARIFWGFFGTKYALFNNFIYSPREALAYMHGLFSGTSKHYLGHNPAASYMILLLLIGSLVVCLSGYKAYTAKEGKLSIELSRSLSLVASACADDDNDNDEGESHSIDRHAARERKERAGGKEEGDSYWEDIHEVSAQFMMALVILHVIGVAVSSKVHNENLIKSMITGKKEVVTDEVR